MDGRNDGPVGEQRFLSGGGGGEGEKEEGNGEEEGKEKGNYRLKQHDFGFGSDPYI